MLPKLRIQNAIAAIICLGLLYGILYFTIKTTHVYIIPQQFIERSDRVEKTQTTIPKIIHQVWNNDIVPAEFIPSLKSLVRDNPSPEWQYIWWTRESGTKLIKDKYPYLLKKFNEETGRLANTLRADMVRILALHEYGGVYFDLDTNSVRPLASFVDNHECSFALEPAEHIISRPNNCEFLLTNSAMFCRAQHPFYKQMLHQLAILTGACVNPFVCTGPLMVTTLFQQLNQSNGDAVKLPDVQSSKLFQDVYYVPGSDRFVSRLCGKSLKEMPPALTPYRRAACSEWHERGQSKRTISELAYTYHTWFHVYGKKLQESSDNNVLNIVPHAKIYGVNL